MGVKGKRYFTQWAAQFYAAAELTRCGYLVSLTLGNAPECDLVVRSPLGVHFEIDVKGVSSRNFWLIQEREPRVDLYFVLVYLTPAPTSPSFFIMSSSEVMAAIADLKRQTIAAGKNWPASGAGINWGTSLTYENRWSILPD
jgi:hypothetical protein